MSKDLHRWTRMTSAKWEDAWEERLRFLAPEQVAFVTWPDSRGMKIEAYCDASTAKRLVARFGGRATRIASQIWTGDPARPRAPLGIRGRLKVFSGAESWRAWRASGRRPPGIYIPAGMAFGTGEHATTATCLRLLADLEPELPEGFRVLDLGTGSGILAVAAECLGAGRVEAIDFDRHAVRIARTNARTNGCRNVAVAHGDALALAARGTYDVVMANLFSEVLIAAASRMARALVPGGWLIFSGVLRRQAGEVSAALREGGFGPPRVIARGKWCAGICRRRKRPVKNR